MQQRGELQGKPHSTWWPLLQDTKTDSHTSDSSTEHRPSNWVLYHQCPRYLPQLTNEREDYHRETSSEIEIGINHKTSFCNQRVCRNQPTDLEHPRVMGTHHVIIRVRGDLFKFLLNTLR